MAKRIRVFVIDEATGKPRTNVPVAISAEFGDSSLDRPASFLLGIFQSDHAGYLSTDVPDTKLMPQHLWVSLLSNTAVRVDASPTMRFSPLPAAVVLKIPAASDALTKKLYPSLNRPDSHDREISPYSFANDKEIFVGQGSCEDFLPNGSPERTFSCNQIMLDADTPPSDLIPTNSNDPTTSAFSQLRRGALIKYSIEWLPLGHALGEILYTLPLAPCESVNLAVIDWKREDKAARQEGSQASEALTHDQRRDRSVEETVSTALREWQSGNTVSVGGSVGLGGGGIAASVTAGASWSSTTGGRNLNGETLQSLADSISQASSFVRSLYSTVIVQSSQTERDSIQTRTIRNHNHCHALTILYYEVLRQYKIITKIAKVQDVILLKQRMLPPGSNMSYATLLAYRHILEDRLLEPRLRSCFEAIVRREYEETPEATDTPSEPESPFIYRLWFYISIPTEAELGHRPDTNKYSETWCLIQRKDTIKPIFYAGGEGLPENGAPKVIEIDPAEPRLRYGMFNGWNDQEIESWEESTHPLKVSGIVKVGVGSDIHATPDSPDGDQWDLGRLRIEYSLVGSETSRQVLYDSKDPSFDTPLYPLPYYFEKSGDVIRAGMIEGHAPSTPWWSPALTVQNTAETTPTVPDPGVSQRKADAMCAKRLLDHVNANGAYYRSLILMNTHPDSYALEFDKIPYQSGTLLEHADFHPIAVFGDYIVFPLNAPTGSTSSGFLAKDLLASQIEPIHTYVSLPTRGILAEAKLSGCNACEEIDVTRFWNWAESPCTDEAPSITGVTPGSRARDIDTRPSEFPSPVVNIVNPPPAPDPTGLAAAMNVIGTPNIFRDMSGRQELSSLLQRLTDGTISLAQARREAQRLQSQPQQTNDNTRSNGSQPRTSARELHDNNQVVRSAVAHGDLSEAEGRRLISAQSRQAILGSESTGPGLSISDSDLPESGNPFLMPLPERDRWYQAWLLLYNFDVDSVDLKPEHTARLEDLLRTLRLVEEYRIETIQGRASETGPEDHNRDLSDGRGSSVQRYMIDHGISETIIPDLPDPPLGSSDPLRARSDYREDEVNRSVLVYLHILIPAERIPPPLPRRRPTASVLSQEWALRVILTGTAHGTFGVSLADLHIKNCRTGEAAVFAMPGGGIGLALGISVGSRDWTSFRTLYPVELLDFDREYGVFYTVEFETPVIGVAGAYLRLPYIVDGAIDLGNVSTILDSDRPFTPGIEVGGFIDAVRLFDVGDPHFQDDTPCS